MGIMIGIDFINSAPTIESNYNDSTRTYSIISNNKEIANLTLISSDNVQVGLGYQKIAEFSVATTQANYKIDNFTKFMETYDLKNNNQSITQIIDYKYKAIKLVNDTQINCIDNNLGNGTIIQNCNEIILPTVHNEVYWKDIDNLTLLEAIPVTISLWTDVQYGDYKEWVMTTVGDIRLDRWATWTGNISVNLVSYYKLDGDVTDAIGANNGFDIGTTDVTGKLGTGARDFESTENDYIRLQTTTGTLDFTTSNISVNAWIKTETAHVTMVIVGGNGSSWVIGTENYGGAADTQLSFGKLGVDEAAHTNGNITKGVWTMVTAVYNQDANLVYLYLNGTLDSGSPDSYSTTFSADLYYMMGVYNIGGAFGAYFDGVIDDVAVFNRALSATEITLLYNSYAGCQYGNESCYPATTCAFQVNGAWSVPSNCTCISPPNTQTFDLSTWSCAYI